MQLTKTQALFVCALIDMLKTTEHRAWAAQVIDEFKLHFGTFGWDKLVDLRDELSAHFNFADSFSI